MTKNTYFAKKKYSSKNGTISTYHIRNRYHIGLVRLGRERQPAYVCLCGCRIYGCSDQLFNIKINREEIDGRLVDNCFFNKKGYIFLTKYCILTSTKFYKCTRKLQKLQ